MITVLFFGQLKERVQTAQLTLELCVNGKQINSVAKLRAYLSTKGEVWQENLVFGQAIVAVNQEMASEDIKINDNDEIAFFPPVTGG